MLHEVGSMGVGQGQGGPSPSRKLAPACKTQSPSEKGAVSPRFRDGGKCRCLSALGSDQKTKIIGGWNL